MSGKVLDQSVFDGLPPEFKWAAVDSDGVACAYSRRKPYIFKGMKAWGFDFYQISVGGGFDSKNWKKSIINRKDSAVVPEPEVLKPIQLDQSVFDGLPAQYKWAAIDPSGHCHVYTLKPRCAGLPVWAVYGGAPNLLLVGHFDANDDWRDSLIERDCVQADGFDETTPQVRFKKLHPDAKIPVRATDGAAGFDLHSTKRIDVPAGQRMLLPTGIACAIPEGWCGQVWPRSGLAVKHGIDRLAGLIDSDYRGELHVSLVNHGQDTWEVKEGERIAQLVFVQVLTTAIEVEDLDDTARGVGGFGSTGK